jgi:methyl-accepting chemotaxis protein
MQLSTVVQAKSATAEETAASSQEMSAQSVTLNDIVSRFKLVRGDGAAGRGSAPRRREEGAGPDNVISLSDDGGDKY